MPMRRMNRSGSKKRLLLQGRLDYEEVVAQEVTTVLTVWIFVCIFVFTSWHV